ncbi:DUF6311 domain-containing protein [Dyella flava]|uniref:Uncharacterized protein n=1 Tax=Dyella flava TaxID=1920170 RepID=A0ABS2K403_9GAMM|nr:DUF6311 domain-containing protein [Dyella flava]MBM7125614.1 hypothetical protein [Dyella flava]
MTLNDTMARARGDDVFAGACLAALAGAMVFYLVFGVGVLEPGSLGWLSHGDSAQSYLGWVFFRHSPWMFPLGAAPAMGMEQSSSIVYTDSIPAFALLFKLLRGVLPTDFQYAGLWLCCCYVLQGYFAYRLLSQFTRDRLALAAGVLLFLISPIMLLRTSAHFALSAHWLIVCALYLYYSPPKLRYIIQWMALLWFVPLVHAYLMFMVYAIWAAYLLRQGVLVRQLSWLSTVCCTVASVAGSITVMWLVGYFGDMDVSTFGFGYYSMNLLAPWMPLGAGPFLLPSPTGATAGQYEGFNYLGLGVLFALLATIVQWAVTRKRSPVRGRHDILRNPDAALILCCVCLTLLALSNVVTFGTHTLFQVSLPARLNRMVNIFRCSGRMFWPVYYVLLMMAVRGLVRWPARASRVMLGIMVLLQLADMRPYLQFTHNVTAIKLAFLKFPDFDSPFWSLARKRYANLYVIPGQYEGDEYIDYEYLAATYGFHIDTAFYARLPSATRQQGRLLRHEAFWGGDLDPNGLYLIQSSGKEKLQSAQVMFSPATGVGAIDGFTVVAPGWFEKGSAPYLQHPLRGDLPPMALDHPYLFDGHGDGLPFLLGGWSTAESGGVWSLGPAAWVAMHRQLPLSDVHVALRILPYLPAKYPSLSVRVEMGGHVLANWRFQRDNAVPDVAFDIPADWQAPDGNLVLAFHFDSPRSPKDAGENADVRTIAIRLGGMQVTAK